MMVICLKIKILSTRENPLLKRKEVIGIIEHKGESTPSKAAVQMYLAKTQKLRPRHVEVKKIFSPVGSLESRLLAYFWREKEVPVLEEKKPEPKAKEKEESKEESPKKG